MKHNKLLAVMIAAMMVSCVAAGAVLQHEDVEEAEAIDPVTAGIIVGLLFGGLTGFVIGSALNAAMNPPGGVPEATRNAEANAVGASIAQGMLYYDNTLRNYTQIWTLTDEHWIRQAELAAAFTWEKDKAFDMSQIMSSANIYANNAHMTHNAVAEVEVHFESIAQRLALWNEETTTYKDKMQIGWAYGLTEKMSRSTFEGHLGTTVKPTTTHNKVYISNEGDAAKYLWVFGGAATMTAADGTVYNLTDGRNNIATIAGWEPGVYTLQEGRQYLGVMAKVNDPAAMTPHAGIVFAADGGYKLAAYTGSKIVIDGVQYNDLSLRVSPDGGTTRTESIKNALTGMEMIIAAVNTTMAHASSAAAAVWNIYTKAGQASAYLTTLTIPNNYKNVEISTAQREVITILSLEQLAKYWNESGGKIKTGDYKLSDDSMQLFVRGDLYSRTGEKLYTNVIYTPFYYGANQNLQTGLNVQSQPCIIAVWDTGVTALSGWDATANIGTMSTLSMAAGSKMDIYEMYYAGSPVSTMTLEVRGIDIIDGNDIDPTPTPPPVPPKPDKTNWLQIAMYIIGAMLLLMGLYTRQPTFMIVGALVIGIGYLGGDWLWGLKK